MKVIAFSPAHITGFFELCYDDRNNIIGTKGAGLSLSVGSYAYANNMASGLCISGNIGNGVVTTEALKTLIDKPINVNIYNELPFSQGFGISGTSSLAATMATSYIYKISQELALKCAHNAEIKFKSGYGDVMPSYLGGLEMRTQPGTLEGITTKKEYSRIIVGIIGKPLDTRKIIENNVHVDKINSAGKNAVDNFRSSFSLKNLLKTSYEFSIESELASQKIYAILKDINREGIGAMCMLGNSVFAVYSKKIKKILQKYQTYECYVDNEGARVLATFSP